MTQACVQKGLLLVTGHETSNQLHAHHTVLSMAHVILACVNELSGMVLDDEYTVTACHQH